MELWIPITIAAAFGQNVRSALQKHLTARLSTAGATQVRFLYAVPFALLYAACLAAGAGYEIPRLNQTFVLYASLGGLAQIVATALLIALFSHRNFFVGTALSKTETIQAAILGFVVLGDRLTAGAVIGICAGIAGVISVTAARSRPDAGGVIASLTSRTSVIGVLIGFFFGVAAVCFRGASLSLDGGTAIRAAVTLVYVIVLQTVVVTVYLAIRERGQMTAVLASWRVGWLVGAAGMLASAGWFTAMTLQNAAYVRAVGQIELVFAFLASGIFFGERTTRAEFAGIALLVAGILTLLRYG